AAIPSSSMLQVMWQGMVRNPCGAAAFLLPALLVPVEIVAFVLIRADKLFGLESNAPIYGMFLAMLVGSGAMAFGVVGVFLTNVPTSRRDPAAPWLGIVGLGLDFLLFWSLLPLLSPLGFR